MPSGLTKEEINRKLLHGLAVFLPMGIFYGSQLTGQTQLIVSIFFTILFLFSLVIDLIRLKAASVESFFFRYFGSMMRDTEKKQLTGATYVMGGSAICSWIALYGLKGTACVLVALTLFILGDAIAALVGKAIGRIKVGDKTLEGSIGCFVFGVLFSLLVFPILPGFQDAWGGPFSIPQIIFISASVSLLELFSIRVGTLTLNDNLYVPAVVSLLAIFVF